MNTKIRKKLHYQHKNSPHQNAKDRLHEAHKVMGISNRLSDYLQTLLIDGAKLHITDKKVEELIQLAMVPNKYCKTLSQDNLMNYLAILRICVTGFMNYAMTSPTLQTGTTKGTVFVHTIPSPDIFKMLEAIKMMKQN